MTLQEFRERYRYTPEKDLIGKGGFAKVYKAFDTETQQWVALKFYHGEVGDKYGVLEEIRRVIDIHHPNLIRYYDAIILKNPSVYDEESVVQVGVLEYANSGNFNDFMQSFPDVTDIQHVIAGLFAGLNFLHKQGIVHRDIKPQNLLMHRTQPMNEWNCKIADFGLAKKIETGEVSSRLLGTVEYMAPEQFNAVKFGINGQLSTNVDLWSMGVIIYEIFTGELPFGNTNEGLDHREVMFQIMEQDLSDKVEEIIEPFRTVVKACLVKDASKRAKTAQTLENMLRHPDLSVYDNPEEVEKYLQGELNELPTFLSGPLFYLGNLLFTPLFGFGLFFLYRKKTTDKGYQILRSTLFAYLAWVVMIFLLFVVVWDVI